MENKACLKVCTPPPPSAIPFVAGCYGADVIWRMPFDLTNAWNVSICAYLRSVLVNDRDAKATGLSLPSGMTCEKTAPMPVGEASHASLTGIAGS